MRASLALLILFFCSLSPGAETNKAQILFFTAAWCAPCHKIRPQVAELAKKYKVALVLVDFDASPRAVEDFQVQSLPTIVLLDSGGRLRVRIEGANRQAIDALASALKALASSRGGSRKRG